MKNKLVLMVRVKDGILFVQEWLQSFEKLVDEIVVVDNGSTDGTLEILKAHSKVVGVIETEGFDEGRDKILLYQLARERKPDWCLWLDIDEIFEDRVTRQVLDKLMESKSITKYWFRRFHFHKDKFHYEASFRKFIGICVHDRLLWKESPSGFFLNIKIHSGLIRGITGRNCFTNYRIKHFGAFDRAYLNRKTDIYLSVDDNERNRKMYVKHRDQAVPTLRWHEFAQSKTKVVAINMLLNIMFPIVKVYQKISNKLFK